MHSSTLSYRQKVPPQRGQSVSPGGSLVVIETHPIQYHVPVYRLLQREFGIPVTVVYGSDFSIAGYHDKEFGSHFAWDTDLVSGYSSVFLSRSADGGAKNDREVDTSGLEITLKRLQPQAVLCVGYSPRFHWQAFTSACRTGKPVLFRAETTDHAIHRYPLKQWFRDTVLRRLYTKCSALLFVGSRSRDHYRRLGIEDDRLFFSPYCVDTSPFRIDEEARGDLRVPARRELGIGVDELVIVFSGKLSRRKGPDQLVEAVRQFPAKTRDRTVVLMIGDGELRDGLQAIASRTPAVKIRQVGFQHQKNLSRFYHAADLLVLPSLHSETWGLVVNEALHHGVPAVVSNAVGCAPDLIEAGKTGEIFSAGSVPELTAALLRCLKLTGTRDVRSRCRAKVENYSTASAAEGIAAAYYAVVPHHLS